MSLPKIYLRVYALGQVVGWASLLLRTFFSQPNQYYTNESIEIHLKIVQTSMILDVFNSAFKLSSSPFIPTFLQISSRIWVVYGVMDLAKASFWIYIASIMWSLAEIIRYSNYLYSDLFGNSKILTWLRYSAFLVLYPVGISSEFLCLRDALAVINVCCPRVFSFEMPNSWNFSFDYLYFIYILVIPSYVAGSPFLYTYMVKQRQKRLSS